MNLTRKVLCLGFVLSAGCGGGGGGGDGGSSSSPGTTNLSGPPSPTISYSGNSQPATIDKTNALELAGLVVGMRPLTQIAESLWIAPPTTAGDVNQTINGTSGGTAVITGSVVGQSSGYLDVNFQSYSEAGLTLNGRYIQRLRSRSSSTQPGYIYSDAEAAVFDFYDLEYTSAGEGFTLRGSIELSGGNLQRFDLNLLVTDTATGATVYYENCAIDFSTLILGPTITRFGLTLSGTVKEQSVGAVIINPIDPLADLEIHPVAGHAIASLGGFNMGGALSQLELRVLSRGFVGLMLDSDGDDIAEEGIRASWGELAGLPAAVGSVTTGPIANAGSNLAGYIDFPVSLHGLYSHDDDGDWLQYEWDLILKPFASQVELDNPNLPLVTFVPDVRGDYVLRLSVTDGSENREVNVLVRARGPRSSARATVTHTAGLEVAEPFQVGAPVVVDGRGSTNIPYIGDSPQWSSEGPGMRTLTDTSSIFVKNLSVSAEGTYLARMSESARGDSISGTYSELPLTFGPRLFDTTVTFWSPYRIIEVASVDRNSDGRLDMILRVARFDGNGFLFLMANDTGGFDEEPLVSVDNADGELATGDLNNDGLLDVAISDADGVYVSFQAPDTSFASAVLYPWPSQNCVAPSLTYKDIGIGDIDGDLVNELLAVNACDRTITVWVQDANGDLTTTEVMPINESVILGTFDDVNGDGRIDAVLGVLGNGLRPSGLVYALGQPDRTLQVVSRIDNVGLSSRAAPTGVGDTNGDGRKDIVMLDFLNVRIFEQQADDSMLESSSTDTGTTLSFASPQVADIDDDGDFDILLCRTGRELHAGIRQPDNTYQYQEIGTCLNTLNGISTPVVAKDLTGDGRTELVVPGDAVLTAENSFEALLGIMIGDFTRYSRSVN